MRSCSIQPVASALYLFEGWIVCHGSNSRITRENSLLYVWSLMECLLTSVYGLKIARRKGVTIVSYHRIKRGKFIDDRCGPRGDVKFSRLVRMVRLSSIVKY